ncbi:MAG: DUF4416 family protein [Candidatus Omnitrophica bacterium]|nr:DUF4416 family protein [Candidatus Omnitrophota bacterium]
MGRPEKPQLVRLFIGMLGGDPELFSAAADILTKKFGPILLESEIIPFKFTDYYTPEMGNDLLRKFIAFKRMVSPEKLASIKLFTNRLEKTYCQSKKRRINLDPGFLTPARVILASTKDFSHRIYLKSGIYAEITFLFHKNGLEFLPWTYPDYRTEPYLKFFSTLRKIKNGEKNG